jgi:hypothetical protein
MTEGGQLKLKSLTDIFFKEFISAQTSGVVYYNYITSPDTKSEFIRDLFSRP